MGGSYRQCTECGKRALSIATRCPGCGREFPAPAVPEGGGRELSRLLMPGGVVAVLAILAVLAVARLGRTSQLAEQGSEVGWSVATTVPLPAPPAESSGELLVARDWTNVRKSRSVSARLEAMLMPGDTVLADSLVRGWYRVALEGEVLGYVHRSTLAALGTRTETAEP